MSSVKIELDVIRGMNVPEGTNEILAVCDGEWRHLHRNHLGRWVVHGGISWVKEFTAWAKMPALHEASK